MVESPPLGLKVFLASPGDVGDERALALKALESLGYDARLRGRVAIETIAWDKPGGDTPMLATMTPQEAISLQRPKPSECDIVVVIFWSRLGTPLPETYIRPNGERYRSGTEWEYLDACAASQQTGRPKVLLYRRTERLGLDPEDPDFTAKVDQWKRVKRFFAECRNPDGSIRAGYNEYDSPDSFRKKFTGHLREIIQSLLADHEAQLGRDATAGAATATSTITALPLWKGSPFPGLRAFTANDAPIFFGRGRETDGLVARLAEGARFIAVVGVSGSGKSSLVAAGLLPRLNDNAIPGSRDWLSVRLTPGELGDNPFIALASAFVSTFETHHRVLRDEAEGLQADHGVLDGWIEQMLEDRPGWSELVLFIDQLEELFTVVRPDHRAPFAELLVHAAASSRVRVLATLRADFYHHCVGQRPLDELLRTGTYPLASPGVGALYEMIARPAERAGLSFEPQELPSRILDDTGDDPGALPLMAFALSELYERHTDDRRLTADAYDGFGGVQGAIGRRAEGTFERLDARAQAALGAVFRELVEVDPTGGGWVATRRRAAFSEATKAPGAKDLVDAFERARLLHPGEGENGTRTVEVAHEALLRNWQRLAVWIEETGADLAVRRQLDRAADEWKGPPPRTDRLWPRRRWKQAEAALGRLGKGAEEPAKSFLAACRGRTRFHVGTLLLGLVVVALGGLFMGFTNTVANGNIKLATSIVKERTLYTFGLSALSPGEPEMVAMHPGENGFPTSFWMGSGDDDKDKERFGDEFPRHEVRFAKPFAVGRYEITFDQYDYFVQQTGARRPDDGEWGRGKRPVMNISWEEATAYARWLSLATGKSYRLPTEAEWEYAARAGTQTEYWWGDDPGENRANCHGCGGAWDDRGQTAPVGSFEANRFGLHDTAGNVFEWTEDCWHGNYTGAPDDGTAWLETGKGQCGLRVMRGGSWNYGPGNLRSGSRTGREAAFRFPDIGFRLARDL
ncbi:MAG: SUMF1/EgtB/PvdO family nonheme iron enzyme [Chromatiaceae bacterium]|nr:SUMF1/EgtB/PvdO family nonheme iron enzyme [Chromatiaceae bacterium]MCP5316046.1 SUMF1/EgtB/PvdO family nonheme iron enzyme [Chromatiaceae bacterium]